MLKFSLHPLTREPVQDASFDAFTADIKAHGQLLPMLGIKGRLNGDIEIFDGGRRLRACEKLGLEPRYLLWDGPAGQLAEVKQSLTLLREHLTPSQRAAFAVKL